MKRCFTSSVIREMQMSGYYSHLLDWPKSRTLTAPNADKDVEQRELSSVAGGNAKWYSHFGRQVWQFLTELNNLIT